MLRLNIFRILSGSAKFTGTFLNAYFTRTITEGLIDFIFVGIALSSLIQCIFYYILHKISDKRMGENRRHSIHLYIQSLLKLMELFTQLNYGYKVSSIRNTLCVESRTIVVFLYKLIIPEKRSQISLKQYFGISIIFLGIFLSCIFKENVPSRKIKPKGFNSPLAATILLISGIFNGILHVHFDEIIKKSTFMEKEYGYKVSAILFIISFIPFLIQSFKQQRNLLIQSLNPNLLKMIGVFTLNSISTIFLMFYFSDLGRLILQQIIKLVSSTSADLLVQRGSKNMLFPYLGFCWICLILIGALFYNNIKFTKNMNQK
ncbi:hypothetical protein H311_01543 [Anncaliia algerae PRA109]|nr:hypothetical protein H311_01543 [Anncaliia algerae PRA109]